VILFVISRRIGTSGPISVVTAPGSAGGGRLDAFVLTRYLVPSRRVAYQDDWLPAYTRLDLWPTRG